MHSTSCFFPQTRPLQFITPKHIYWLLTDYRAGTAQTSAYVGRSSGCACSPQAGQFGSRKRRSSLNSPASASYVIRRPTNGSPIPSSTLIVSVACNRPMIPGSTPSTPASAQLGASAGGGGSG